MSQVNTEKPAFIAIVDKANDPAAGIGQTPQGAPGAAADLQKATSGLLCLVSSIALQLAVWLDGVALDTTVDSTATLIP